MKNSVKLVAIYYKLLLNSENDFYDIQIYGIQSIYKNSKVKVKLQSIDE